MKAIFCLLLIATVLSAVACGDDDDATPSPTSSAAATATSAKTATPTTAPVQVTLTISPTPTPQGTIIPALTAFGTFAQQVDAAVQAQDANFFSNLGVEQTITCTGNESGGPCEGQPANTTFTGILGVAWQSDAGSYTPIAAYNTMIAQWFSDAMPAQTDSYGNGVPRLAAIAGDSVNGDFYAIATLILDTSSTQSLGIQRQSRAFRFAPDGSGGFDLTGEVLGAVSATADQWLGGPCTGCYYDSFQTWP